VKQASRDARPMLWVRPPRFRLQARVGPTAAHEGGAKSRSRHGGLQRLGEAQASPTRNGPYRRKASRIEEAVAGHAAMVETILAALAREDPRESVKHGPTKTGAGEATGMPEVGCIGCLGGQHPRSSRRVSNQGRMQPAKAEARVCVRTSSPGPQMGPKTHRVRTRRKSRGRTGNQRVRVIVVESLGSRHRTNVSMGACSAERRKACRRDEHLARRKPIPG
jgi:hypothetical protein